jgi:hypothetical protein
MKPPFHPAVTCLGQWAGDLPPDEMVSQNSLKLKKIMQPVEIFVIASEGLNIIIINRKRRDQKFDPANPRGATPLLCRGRKCNIQLCVTPDS